MARDFSSSRRAPPMAASAAVLVERLLQRLGLHDVGVAAAMRERRDARGLAGFVRVDDQLGVQSLRGLVAERNHLLELPARVDVQQREGNASGEEGLAGQVQQHRGVLADGIHQDGLRELGRHLAEDVDAFGFELAPGASAAPRPYYGARPEPVLMLSLAVPERSSETFRKRKKPAMRPALRSAGDCTDGKPRARKAFLVMQE